MAINFDKIPTERTNGVANFAEGKYIVKTVKIEYTSSKSGNPMVVVSFESQDKKVQFKEFITESDNDFAVYKLGRLMHALDVTLTGNVELKDLAKIIPVNKTIEVELIKNDKGYPTVSFKGNSEGFYKLNDNAAQVAENTELPSDVKNAVVDAINQEDPEF